MSIENGVATNAYFPLIADLPVPAQPLHRLAAVRKAQGITRRSVARRMHTTVEDVRLQECRTTDLPLSILHRWATALEVPIAELLVEPSDSLSPAIMKRAQTVLCMKTAKAILQRGSPPVRRMAEMLIEQLAETMPELKGIGAWPEVGRRRGRGDLGRAAQRVVSLHGLDGLSDE